jgi:SAM-dependent methyltransferase
MSPPDQLFDDAVVDQFLAHYKDLRGRVRTEVVRRHLATVVLNNAKTPLRVLDVGCGDGRDCVWLAEQGHRVVGLDPAEAMIERARERAAGTAIAGRVEFDLGDVDSALQSFGPDAFDLVLSHGVLMYQSDPAPFVAAHVELVRRNGIVSLLAKNADAQSFRAAQEASVDEAIRLLDDSNGLGHLGLPSGAQTLQELADMAFGAGATVRSWAGVRMFSDSPSEPLREADVDKVIQLEWLASSRDPHRRTGALLHLLLLRGVDLSLLPA